VRPISGTLPALRAQARPEMHVRAIAGVGKQLERAPGERLAAQAVESVFQPVSSAVPRRASDRQPCHHDLPLEVGERHHRRALVFADADRRRVALGGYTLQECRAREDSGV
jgi:hypothetical protein